MVLSTDQLSALAGRYALVDGVFDPIHAGHLAYFRAAAEWGPLCCHVSEVQRHPPLLFGEERAAILDAFKLIQCVHVGDISTEEVIRRLRPTHFIKGADWRERLPESHYQACAEVGCAIVFTDGLKRSSSALLREWQHRSDASALYCFERAVMTQSAATHAWQPVTDYSFEARKTIEGRHPELIWQHLIQSDHAEVLDYGCGPDGHLVQLLSTYRDIHGMSHQVTIEGYDPQARWPLKREVRMRPVWDVVICREVLEHLTVIALRQTVTTLCRLSAQYVYVTTRFHPDPAHLLDWAEQDDLDPDHRTLLNQDLLRVLFVLEGFQRRRDLEEALDWQQQGRVLVYERTARAPRD